MNEVKLYTQYPVASVALYNGTTILHYLIGGYGIAAAYSFTDIAWIFGLAYFFFAAFQMYVLMPLKVCPNCVYFKLEDSICISGLNLISRKVELEGDVQKFADRGKGLLCHNNLYIAAKIFPILAMLPALFISFSMLSLSLFLSVIGLMLFRIFILFPKVACVHCRAKNICPNAISMGLSK